MARLLNMIMARSYLSMMANRTKNEVHESHLRNAFNQIVYLEDWRSSAIKVVNERDLLIKEQGEELRELRNKNNEYEVEVIHLREEVKRQKELIENMSEGMVARCDLCGSEEPI